MKKRVIVSIIMLLLVLVVAVPSVYAATKFSAPSKYEVAFYNEQELFYSYKAKRGELVEFPSDYPDKQHDNEYSYNFLGWAVEGTTEIIDVYTVVANVNFCAIYEAEPIPPATVTVTFKDAPEFGGKVLATKSVEIGGTVEAPEQPYHLGYIFSGWNKELTNIRSRTEIVAEYNKKSYNFVKNYLAQTTNENLPYKSNINLSNPIEDDALIFEGWFLDENFEHELTNTSVLDETVILDENNFTIEKETEQISIYAKFSINVSNLSLQKTGTLIYGGNNLISVAGQFNKEGISYSYTWQTDEQNANLNAASLSVIDAGKHNVSVEINVEYKGLQAQTTLNTEIEIEKATLTANLTANNVEYGQNVNFALNISGFKFSDEQTLLQKINANFNLNRSDLNNNITTSNKAGSISNLPVGEYVLNANLTYNEVDLKNYTFENENLTKNVNVNKKDLTISFKQATKTNYVYGEQPSFNEQDLEFSGFVSGESVENLTQNFGYEIKQNGENVTKFNVGSYTVDVNKNSYSSNNYNIIYPQSLNITVAAKDITITINASKSNITYGEEIELTKSYTEFAYAEDKSAFESLNSYTFKDSEQQSYSLINRFECGSYSVGLNIGNINENDTLKNYNISVEEAQFNVGKRDLTISFKQATKTNYVYGEQPSFNEQDLEFSGFVSGESVENLTQNFGYEIKQNGENVTKFNVGSYTVDVNKNSYSSNNYNIIYPQSLNITVAAKDITITINASKSNITYGEEIELTKSYTEFAYAEDKSAFESLNNYTYFKDSEQNSYNLTTKYFDNGKIYVGLNVNSENDILKNYKITIKKAEFSVQKREFNINYEKIMNKNRSADWSLVPQFEGENLALFTFEGTLKINTTEQCTIECENASELPQYLYWNGNDFKITINGGNGEDVKANFDIKYSFNIELSTFNFQYTPLTNVNIDYDGESHSYPLGEVQIADPEIEAGEIKVYYTYVVKSGNGESNLNKTETAPSFVNAGVYEISYEITDGYETETKSFTLTINQAENELQNIDEIFTDSAEETEPKITTKQNETDVTYQFTGEEHEINLQKITASFGQNVKIELISAPNKILNSKIKLAAFEDVDLSAFKFSNAGEYVFKITVAGTGNYTAIEHTIKIVVEKANYVVKAEGISATYDGLNKFKQIEVTAIADEKFSVNYGLTEPNSETLEIINASDYTVHFKVFGNSNFNDYTGEFNIKIEKFAITQQNVVLANNEYTFNAKNQGEGVEIINVPASQNVKVYYGNSAESCNNLTAPTYSNANAYTVFFKVTGDENYIEFSSSYTINIKKFEITNQNIQIPENVFTFNNNSQGEAVGVINLPDDDYIINYTYTDTTVQTSQTAPKFINAGSYNVNFEITGNNYTFSADNSYTIVINKANYSADAVPEATFNQDKNIILKLEKGTKISNYLTFKNELINWKEDYTLQEGSKTYYAVYNLDSNNYNDYVYEITLTATKQTVEVDEESLLKTMEINVGETVSQGINLKDVSGTVKNVQNYSQQELTHLGETIKVNSTGINNSVGGTYIVEYTFKIDSEYFNLASNQKVTGYCKVKSVSLGTDVLYTIEDALNTAENGTITLKADTKFMSNEDKQTLNDANINLYQGEGYYTIKSGVNLFLPYNQGKTTVNEMDRNFRLAIETKSVQLKKLELTIPADITLTNKGTIQIGGITTGGNGGKSYAGQTSSDYAQITLGNNAKIDSYGNIECYGFIVEESNNNNSQVIMNSGNLTMPFVVVEHRGGTNFKDLAGGFLGALMGSFKGAPFNRFFMQNVIAKLTIKSTATLLGHANLYAGGQDNTTNIKLIGSAKDCLIQLNANARVETYYHNPGRNIDLNIFGNATINALSLSVSGANISTKKVLFPITWYYNINLYTLEGESSSTINSTGIEGIKLMPGAALTINKGVTLNVKKLAVYDKFSGDSLANPTHYENENTTPAKLVVNGTLVADAVGGEILAGETGNLQIKGNSVTSYEVADSAKYVEFKFTLQLKTATGTVSDAGNYIAENGVWRKE